jgi:predicted dehydrogenase
VHQIAAQINYIPGNQDTTIQPPPASLDWEAWCGPAPKLEYRPNIAHKAWRLEKQYGNGHLVDWGIHLIDGIRLIMDETMPTEFYTRGGIHEWKNKITTPDTLTANMAFRKAPVVWQHRLWGTGDPVKEFNNGIFFHGEKGTLFTNDSKIILYPAGKDAKPEEMVIQNVAMQENHMENFLKAVRTREKHILRSTPEDAFQSTATVQLAMIALDSNSLVQWDSTKNEITGNKAASMWMKREYRGPYKHP